MLRPSEPRHGQINGREPGAAIEAHLTAQQERPLDMRLHGPGSLSVLNSEGMHHGVGAQAFHRAKPRHHTKTTAGGWPEKFHH